MSAAAFVLVMWGVRRSLGQLECWSVVKKKMDFVVGVVVLAVEE